MFCKRAMALFTLPILFWHKFVIDANVFDIRMTITHLARKYIQTYEVIISIGFAYLNIAQLS